MCQYYRCDRKDIQHSTSDDNDVIGFTFPNNNVCDEHEHIIFMDSEKSLPYKYQMDGNMKRKWNRLLKTGEKKPPNT